MSQHARISSAALQRVQGFARCWSKGHLPPLQVDDEIGPSSYLVLLARACINEGPSGALGLNRDNSCVKATLGAGPARSNHGAQSMAQEE